MSINLFAHQIGTKYTGSITLTKNEPDNPDKNNIIDGNVATYDLAPNIWTYWQLELGSAIELCNVKVYLDNGGAGDIEITASSDGVNWTRIMYLTDTADVWQPISKGVWKDVWVTPTINAKYIRVYTAGNNVRLSEVEVYYGDNVDCTITSDAVNFDEGADSDDEVRRRMWLFDTARPWSWIEFGKYAKFDLGSEFTVNQIDTYIADADNHSIQISTDNINWTTVFSGVAVTNTWQERTTNLPATVRYIKFNAISNSELRQVRVWIAEPQPEIIKADSFSLSDSIELNLSLEKSEQSDTFNLNDSIYLWTGKTVNQEDTFNLNDGVDLTLLDRPKKWLDEGFNLDDSIDIVATYMSYYDVNNKINTVKQVFSNILNKINSVIQVFGNINNKVNIGIQRFFNINNKINTQKLELNDIKNDVRFVKSFQIAGDAGFQSLGKEYIKVYIDSIEQIDIDVDSISISQVLNSAHTCDFTLAREYDSTAPTQKSIVEIKYHTWVLYKGYITGVSPGDSPESIKITCQDKYWEQNLENEYFYVGHDSGNDRETFYNTISQGLGICGASFGVGGFVPQTINCDGVGNSDAITSLVTKAGNYGWYYDENNVKKLWVAGNGDIINLEPQELEKNIGLHQIIGHTINESIEGLVNQFKVQMGDSVTKKFKKDIKIFGIHPSSGKQWVVFNFVGWEYKCFEGYATPKWDDGLEKLAKDSSDGYGWDNPKNNEEQKYNDVFVRYHLPELDSMLLEGWTNRYPPEITIASETKSKISGFTLDYENNELILTQPIYNETKDENGEILSIRRPILKVKLWKKIYHPSLDDINYPGANPETDITNPLMFFTPKMGNYPETTLKSLNLSSFSIQRGGSYKDSSGKRIYIPSWDDTLFAKDYANWQLSKKCDVKKIGSITLTIDAMKFYGIELNKRIRIDGVIDEATNIKSITYNISEFTATINLENGRYYNRTTSLQWHGC